MSRRTPQVPAVVLAMNVNGLAVARTLGRHGVPVIGVRQAAAGPELRTRHLDALWDPRGDDAAALLALLREHADPDVRPVLFPVTDDSVRVVAENHEELSRGYRPTIGDPAAVLSLLSKKGVEAAARRRGVPVPRTFVVEDEASFERMLSEVRLPCVLKPQDKSSAWAATGVPKALRFDDPTALRATYARVVASDPHVVVQEWVPGGDGAVWFCLMALAGDGTPLATFVGRKLRQWPVGCGGTAACTPAHAPELETLSTAFARAEGLAGLCSVEFKRDPRDGAFYMIEPTVGRSDWQNAVADANGVPLPWLVYRSALGLPVPQVRRKRFARRWVDLAADRKSAAEHRRRGELTWFGWLRSLRPPVRGAWCSLEDPGPMLDIAAATVRRAGRKFVRRRSARPLRTPETTG